MNEKDLETLLRRVYQLDLIEAPKHHRDWTPSCPPLPRYRDIVLNPDVQDSAEREHMDNCKYCQMTLRMVHEEVAKE